MAVRVALLLRALLSASCTIAAYGLLRLVTFIAEAAEASTVAECDMQAVNGLQAVGPVANALTLVIGVSGGKCSVDGERKMEVAELVFEALAHAIDDWKAASG